MKLKIIKHEKKSLVSVFFLETFLQFLEKDLVDKKILPSLSNKELVVAFVSSTNIQNLNKQFLKKNHVTDVLSFFPVEKNSFGELALCGKQIQSQAKDHKWSIQEEIAYLVLHGFLHLLGYHHEGGGREAQRMYKLQDRIFEKWQSLRKVKKD